MTRLALGAVLLGLAGCVSNEPFYYVLTNTTGDARTCGPYTETSQAADCLRTWRNKGYKITGNIRG